MNSFYKATESFVELKVFCMCNSFVTRNEGNTKPRSHKEMFDSFQARIDTDKTSQCDE